MVQVWYISMKERSIKNNRDTKGKKVGRKKKHDDRFLAYLEQHP